MSTMIRATMIVAVLLAGCGTQQKDLTGQNPVARSLQAGEKPRARSLQAMPVRELLDRAALIAAGAAVTTSAYPNADDVVVDDYTMIEYGADGTSVEWSDSCIKVLTEKGKRDNLNVSLGYDVVYGTVTVDRVEIIKPDGTVVPVDLAAQSKHMIESSQMEMNIYDPNGKELSVGVPGLDIGDLRRVVSRRVDYKTYMPDMWCYYSVFETLSPLRHSVLDVSGPASRPLARIALKAGISNTVTSATSTVAGTNRYVWTVENVPRMYLEPAMPELESVVQRLLISTIPDWQTVSRWGFALCEPHLAKTTPEMRSTVANLTRGCTTPQARMEAVFHYVSQKIRYMGLTIETEAPGCEPHDVDITFNNKYGVCRDKAALLVAMLRIAGFKAYPVLISFGPKIDDEVPLPYFNHEIAGVEGEDGSISLMDPTDENTRELFPAFLCNRSYLVEKPEGATLRTSPITPAADNMLTVRTTGALDASGTLKAETVLSFNGINDNAYRGQFAQMRADERRQMLESVVKRIAAGATLLDVVVQPADMLDTSTNLTITLSFEAKDVPVRGAGVTMIPALWAGSSLGLVNFVIGQTGLDVRKYPLETTYACGVRDTFLLDVGRVAGAPLSLPITCRQASSNISWWLELAPTGTCLSGVCDFRINTVEIVPDEYRELKRVLKAMEFDRRKQAVYAASVGGVDHGADVRVLDERTACDILDEHRAKIVSTVRKKTLTYNGTRAHAELKVDYNPAWESVSLDWARTIGTNGVAKAIAAQEMNIMDADWVASAPRYPAAKILVATLPDVDVDSVIEYQVTRTIKDRPFLSFEQYFRGFDPVDTAAFMLNAPVSFPLVVTNTPGGTVPMARIETGGRVTMTWSMTNLPALKPEKDLPPWWQFNAGVVASAGTWPAYAKEVAAALTPAAAGQTAALARAAALVKDVQEPVARIRAIRDFIEKNIRQAGPSLPDLPLSAISPADTTLADGYGNPADRAVLYHAMLTAAGFAPEFVLGSWEAKCTALASPALACPQREAFSDVLVRVKVGNDLIYLNDTDQYAEPGTTPHDGYPGLVLSSGNIETLRAADGKADRSETSYHVVFADNGDAVITRRRQVYGSEFASFHQEYAEMTPEERRRAFLEMVADLSQSAVAVSNLVTRFDTYPGVEEFTVRAERYAVNDGTRFYFTLPADVQAVPGTGTDTRENPLYWDDDVHAETTVVITLPPKRQQVLLSPPEFTWQAPSGGGTVTVTTAHGSGTLTMNCTVTLHPAVIPGADYQLLLDANRKLTHPGTRTVLLGL